MVHHGPDSPDDLPGHYPVQGKEPRGADSLVSDVCLSPSTSLSAVSVPLQATPVVHFAHGFHVWNITVRPPALSTYLFVDCSVSDHPVLKQAQKVLRDEFKIDHSTNQINCVEKDCRTDDLPSHSLLDGGLMGGVHQEMRSSCKTRLQLTISRGTGAKFSFNFSFDLSWTTTRCRIYRGQGTLPYFRGLKRCLVLSEI